MKKQMMKGTIPLIFLCITMYAKALETVLDTSFSQSPHEFLAQRFLSTRILESQQNCDDVSNKKYYYDSFFGTCRQCDNECDKGCSDNPSKCNPAGIGKYVCKNKKMYDTFCVESCFDNNKEPKFWPIPSYYYCQDECGDSCECQNGKCIKCKNPNHQIYEDYNVCRPCGSISNSDNLKKWSIVKKDSQNYCIKCHQTCSSCTGTTYNDCTACEQPLKLQDKQCLQKCKDGFYDEEQVCKPCMSGCQSCSFNQLKKIPICIKCAPLKFLEDNACVSKCKVGSYGSPNGICYPCSNQDCEDCQLDSSNKEICITCNNDFLKKGTTCVKECGNNFYPSQSLCMPCDQTCLTCENGNNCLSCPETTFLHADNSCQKCEIQNGYFKKWENNKITCLKCAVKNCKTCEEDKCTSCFGENYLHKDEQGNLSCAPCEKENGYQVIGQECSKCPAEKNCKKCEDNKCTECNGNQKFQPDGSCSACASNQFENEKQQCISCDNSKCKSCNKSPSFCTICQEGESGEAQYVDEQGNCSNCEGKGFYKKNEYQCFNCIEYCDKCENSEECLKCSDNLFLREDKKACIPCTETGQYQKDGNCYQCEEKWNCLTCTYNKSSDKGQCETCPSGFYKHEITSLCVTCSEEEGVFVDQKDNLCKKCSGNCLTCSDSFDHCTSCSREDKLYLKDDNTCSTCATVDGYFIEIGSEKCKECSKEKNCKTCRDSNTCLTCSSNNLYLNEFDVCIECKQENGVYLSQQNKCLSCNTNLHCKTCKNGEACETCKDSFFELREPSLTCIEKCDMFGFYSEIQNEKNMCLNCKSALGEACLECSDSKSCKTCTSEKFFLNSETKQCSQCMENCQKCSEAETCEQCIEGRYFDASEKQCKSCPENCHTCTDANTCTQCKVNHFLDEETKLCAKCIQNCIKCSDAHECTLCNEGFFSDSQKQCKECSSAIGHCQECSDAQTCTICQENFFLFEGKTCEPCERDGVYKDKSDGKCKLCRGDCITCQGPNTCQKCKEADLYVNSQGQCVSCKNDGEYHTEEGKCLKCDSLSNCKICSNATTCISCIEGTFESHKDDKLSCIEKCDMEGFFIEENKICKACIENCKKCQRGNSCNTCQEGFVYEKVDNQPNQTNGEQKKDDVDNGICKKCKLTEYYKADTAKCTLCTITYQNCIECNSKQCIQCAKGFKFSLENNICVEETHSEKEAQEVNETLDKALSGVNGANVPLSVIGSLSPLPGASFLSFSSQSFQQLGNFVIHKEELKKKDLGVVFMNQFYQYNLFSMMPQTKIFQEGKNENINNTDKEENKKQAARLLNIEYKQKMTEPELTVYFFDSMLYYFITLGVIIFIFTALFFLREKSRILRKIHARRTDFLVAFIFFFSNYALFSMMVSFKNMSEMDMSNAASILSIISIIFYCFIYFFAIKSHYHSVQSILTEKSDQENSILLSELSSSSILSKNFWLIFEGKKLLQIILTVAINNALGSLICAFILTLVFSAYIAIIKPIASLLKRSYLLVLEIMSLILLITLMVVTQSSNDSVGSTNFALVVIGIMNIISLIATISVIISMIITFINSLKKPSQSIDSSVDDLRNSTVSENTEVTHRLSENLQKEKNSDFYGINGDIIVRNDKL